MFTNRATIRSELDMLHDLYATSPLLGREPRLGQSRGPGAAAKSPSSSCKTRVLVGCYDLRVTFIPVSRIFGNEDDILIFPRNVRKQVVS